jgi:hypothetical protein
MEDRKKMLSIVGGGLIAAACLGGLMWFLSDDVDKKREEIAKLQGEITSARVVIAKTPDLEREVILQRETDQVVKTILPNDEDIFNFVRTLRTFEERSQVSFSSIKDKAEPRANNKNKADFDKVTYSLQFSGDAFQILSFLHEVESHERFMRVPAFKIKAAKRQDLDERMNAPRHSVDLEVETYVYAPNASGQKVDIEGYETKRDLLRTEISSRQRELTVEPYDYRGSSNRRDPWVDPRVPNQPDDITMLSIEEQISIVEELIVRTQSTISMWEEWRGAENLIAEMKSRGELEKHLGTLEEDVRRIDQEGQLLFVPAERRFQAEVVDELERIREMLENDEGAQLPVVMLRQAIDTMYSHLEKREYQLALDAFAGIEVRLANADIDAVRRPMVERLLEYAHQAETVLAFDELDIAIQGVADLGPDHRAVLIDGRTYLAGELVQPELMIKAIEEELIRFVFRDVELAKAVGI